VESSLEKTDDFFYSSNEMCEIPFTELFIRIKKRYGTLALLSKATGYEDY